MGSIRHAFKAGACVALIDAATFAAPAASIVPPKDCHSMKVGGKRYYVKADQIGCDRAKRYARRYLRSHRSPNPFKCHKGDRGSALVVSCINTKPLRDQQIHVFRRKGR